MFFAAKIVEIISPMILKHKITNLSYYLVVQVGREAAADGPAVGSMAAVGSADEQRGGGQDQQDCQNKAGQAAGHHIRYISLMYIFLYSSIILPQPHPLCSSFVPIFPLLSFLSLYFLPILSLPLFFPLSPNSALSSLSSSFVSLPIYSLFFCTPHSLCQLPFFLPFCLTSALLCGKTRTEFFLITDKKMPNKMHIINPVKSKIY